LDFAKRAPGSKLECWCQVKSRNQESARMRRRCSYSYQCPGWAPALVLCHPYQVRYHLGEQKELPWQHRNRRGTSCLTQTFATGCAQAQGWTRVTMAPPASEPFC